jgi:cytochrome oxidase Cu insertion factor (SCO1/SenC/PrrC family)
LTVLALLLSAAIGRTPLPATSATDRVAADPVGTYELPVIAPAADFAVLDSSSGSQVRLSDFRGRAVLLCPFYTRCADGNGCPLASATLARVQRLLAARGLGDRAVLMSVTFDEQRDTPAVLRAHRDAIGAAPGWVFATPETPERRADLLAAYDLRIAHAPDRTITHALRVYLIDPSGRIRQIYSQSFLAADVIANDVETALREGATTDREP